MEWCDKFPGRASRGSCQFGTWVRTDSCCPKLSFICAWRPGPDLCTPARMPRAGPCQPIREAAARVSDSAAVTPGRTRSPTSQREDLPECVGALGACQVPVRCCRPALCCRHVPVEVCRWRGHLLAAWSLLCGLSPSFGGS